jgi:hypothetical protein
MQTVFSPLMNVYQTQLEASRRFADVIFDGTGKIDQIMIDAIHGMVNRQLSLAHSMATARDPQSAASTLQSNLLSRGPDDTMNYQKEIMRIIAEMQNDIGKSMQEYIERLGSNAAAGTATGAATLEATQQQANDAVYNPMTSMFSVWESAFKEAAALAKKNMATAQSTIEDVTNKAMGSAATLKAGAGSMAESGPVRSTYEPGMQRDETEPRETPTTSGKRK